MSTAHKLPDTQDLIDEPLAESVLRHLIYSVGKDKSHASLHDWNVALSMAVRDRLVEGWIDTTREIYAAKQKRVYYLSMEFMIGRMLEDNLTNLGLMEEAVAFLKDEGLDVADVINAEQDAALGNGGLGRLAACFMDSMSTTGVLLGIDDLGDVQSLVLQKGDGLVHQAEIGEVVLQHASDHELHGEVVDALLLGRVDLPGGLDPAFHQAVAHGHGQGHVPVVQGGMALVLADRVDQVADNGFRKRLVDEILRVGQFVCSGHTHT